MHTLSITYAKSPSEHPHLLDMSEMVTPTANVTPKRGEDFYLCNPFDEIIEARDNGEPFVAHMVIGMLPKRVVIEPGSLIVIKEV